ncbi:hypothetical protein ACF0H5_000935 [Mactra antiquata]
MWLNFKENERQKPVAQGIARQNSTHSSVRSNKSNKSSTSLLKKKIEEHAFQTNTAEWQKEQEYKSIRERRKKLRQQTRKRLRMVRRMYIPAILGMILGTIVLFGSTIQSLGEGSVLYTYSDQFKYVGVITIVAGTVLLLTAVGMEGNVSDKMKKEGIIDVKPIIHPDFLFEEDRKYEKTDFSLDKKYGADSSRRESDDAIWKLRSNDEEEGLLCSSISSATSHTPLQGNEITSRWARAMAMNFDNVDSGPRSPRYSENCVHKYSLPICGSTNTPFIQISSVDDKTNTKMTAKTSMSPLSSAAMTGNSTSGMTWQHQKFPGNDQCTNNCLDVPSAVKHNMFLNDILEESNC